MFSPSEATFGSVDVEGLLPWDEPKVIQYCDPRELDEAFEENMREYWDDTNSTVSAFAGTIGGRVPANAHHTAGGGPRPKRARFDPQAMDSAAALAPYLTPSSGTDVGNLQPNMSDRAVLLLLGDVSGEWRDAVDSYPSERLAAAAAARIAADKGSGIAPSALGAAARLAGSYAARAGGAGGDGSAYGSSYGTGSGAGGASARAAAAAAAGSFRRRGAPAYEPYTADIGPHHRRRGAGGAAALDGSYGSRASGSGGASAGSGQSHAPTFRSQRLSARAQQQEELLRLQQLEQAQHRLQVRQRLLELQRQPRQDSLGTRGGPVAVAGGGQMAFPGAVGGPQAVGFPGAGHAAAVGGSSTPGRVPGSTYPAAPGSGAMVAAAAHALGALEGAQQQQRYSFGGPTAGDAGGAHSTGASVLAAAALADAAAAAAAAGAGAGAGGAAGAAHRHGTAPGSPAGAPADAAAAYGRVPTSGGGGGGRSSVSSGRPAGAAAASAASLYALSSAALLAGDGTARKGLRHPHCVLCGGAEFGSWREAQQHQREAHVMVALMHEGRGGVMVPARARGGGGGGGGSGSAGEYEAVLRERQPNKDCPDCGRDVDPTAPKGNTRNMERHRAAHGTVPKNYVCLFAFGDGTVCGAAFAEKGKLQRHETTHASERMLAAARATAEVAGFAGISGAGAAGGGTVGGAGVGGGMLGGGIPGSGMGLADGAGVALHVAPGGLVAMQVQQRAFPLVQSRPLPQLPQAAQHALLPLVQAQPQPHPPLQPQPQPQPQPHPMQLLADAPSSAPASQLLDAAPSAAPVTAPASQPPLMPSRAVLFGTEVDETDGGDL